MENKGQLVFASPPETCQEEKNNRIRGSSNVQTLSHYNVRQLSSPTNLACTTSGIGLVDIVGIATSAVEVGWVVFDNVTCFPSLHLFSSRWVFSLFSGEQDGLGGWEMGYVKDLASLCTLSCFGYKLLRDDKITNS